MVDLSLAQKTHPESNFRDLGTGGGGCPNSDKNRGEAGGEGGGGSGGSKVEGTKTKNPTTTAAPLQATRDLA